MCVNECVCECVRVRESGLCVSVTVCECEHVCI